MSFRSRRVIRVVRRNESERRTGGDARRACRCGGACAGDGRGEAKSRSHCCENRLRAQLRNPLSRNWTIGGANHARRGGGLLPMSLRRVKLGAWLDVTSHASRSAQRQCSRWPAWRASPRRRRRARSTGRKQRAASDLGRGGCALPAIAAPAYADGIGRRLPAPPARLISNRIFNDVGQNLFSENDVTQWGWVWGQFLDHDFGLRDERVIEIEPIGFSAADPLESFETTSTRSTSGALRRRTARV